MFVELVESLRCPRIHDETWLVATADKVDGREIVEGTLGCPICHAEYPIRQGVVRFDATMPPASPPVEPPTSDHAMRLAAFLDLSDRRGYALLCGSWGSLVPLLRDLVPTHLIAMNPEESLAASSGASVLRVGGGTIPLTPGTCRGIAVDAAHASDDYLEAAAGVLRPSGRLVAPASTPVPAAFTEIARDTEIWIAERSAPPSGVVPLRRRADKPTSG